MYKTLYGARMAQKKRLGLNKFVIVGLTPLDPEICELVVGGLEALQPLGFVHVAKRDLRFAKEQLVSVQRGEFTHLFGTEIFDVLNAE